MDCSLQSHILTADQRDCLNAFFACTDAFYLTGGTALAAFYLGHRTSVDLDLFTQSDEAFAQFRPIMAATAARLGVHIEAIRETPYFKHFQAHMPGGALTLHAARDVSVRLAPVQHCGNLRIDSIEDITANKLCAMLGRSSMKDFVDLYFLHHVGFTIEHYLEPARQKDGGLEAATLAYAISQLVIETVPSFMVQPVTREQLQQFKDAAIARLIHLAYTPTAK